VEWFDAQQKTVSITTVTCGSWHTGAVDKNQNLYMWGRGDFGQIGNSEVRTVSQKVTKLSESPAVSARITRLLNAVSSSDCSNVAGEIHSRTSWQHVAQDEPTQAQTASKTSKRRSSAEGDEGSYISTSYLLLCRRCTAAV
jgi:alpha-tubulin suppressor-like RCC1 family protein